MVASGEMNRRFRLLQPVDTVDKRGGTPAEYKSGADVWAKVEGLQSFEVEAGDAPHGVGMFKVTVYHTVAITQRTVLQDTVSGERFEILGKLDPADRRMFLELTCMAQEKES